MLPRTDVGRRSTNVTPEATEAKPLRRDAELNLARILIAARDVFAEQGYEASMEQIAARAQVGVGTLYRRFPDEAVFEFVRRCVEAPSCWRAATSRRPWSGGGADRALAVLVPLIGRIIEASQRAGTVRPEVLPTDLVMTLMSVRALSDLCDADAPGASRRF